MQLCVSEATTNMLVHGGGGGTMRVCAASTAACGRSSPTAAPG